MALLRRVLVAVLAAVLVVPGAAHAAAGGPSLREATLNHLYGFANGRTIGGMHHQAEVGGAHADDWPTHWSAHISAATGQWPGLWGADFVWWPADRARLVEAAVAEHEAGALVTLMWHSCRPKVTAGTPCRKSPVSGTPDEKLTDAEWGDLLTEGTALNQAWYRELDVIAGHLAQLRGRGVGVLWRPLHEMNDSWAWYGGRGAQTRRLYELMHDYYDAKGLDNLVWVWNVVDKDPAGFATYLPAPRYVDVLSLDVWNTGVEPAQADYDTLVALAAGRPVALGEVKKVPSPGLLARQPRWSWFLLWPDTLDSSDPAEQAINSPAVLRETYGSPRVLSRARLVRPPLADDLGPDLARGRPIWAKSSESSWLDARWAVDGDSRTRWSSAYADDQWIYLQLAGPTVVRDVRLDWEAAHAEKFQVQLSTDGVTWWTTGPDRAGTAGVQTIAVTETRPVRYVKIYAWERATAYGYSLWSLTVHGDPA